ncbi:uncharacterized protein LOC62_01G000434 [Vanrija pseudolonga]|uniref:Uncharacterized protein n=1 Tax=Vanrija pseudolonga TaxID=143232 RepID=A0AAF0Y2B9_9TREE|nr:hypothetical protein LOC62_01G000434 [Vanrija pseudolonga]
MPYLAGRSMPSVALEKLPAEQALHVAALPVHSVARQPLPWHTEHEEGLAAQPVTSVFAQWSPPLYVFAATPRPSHDVMHHPSGYSAQRRIDDSAIVSAQSGQ